ncbi:MAG: radical SAM protein [Dehalococcoides mccartyi]|uniref:Radical SAM domain-containing protein n=2 Tax=root TaxID=1 RepID=A0AB33HUB6_9CHLR|nr:MULTISPECIES: radical SAM protein [Dehalococcoides]MEA4879157.1 radical SAM protein [Dehalococcoides mccartyi]POZ59779.1 radical activating enzyme [Dehalococcoides mccartyi]BAZ97767.1 radical SAM domain-containing protein [Dehalococcoides mccartyi]
MNRDTSEYTPRYLELYESGELKQRLLRLEERMAECDLCPRKCGVNRLLNDTGGYCHSGNAPIVAAVCEHLGEEPAISGDNGSGTVFFSNCNLRCAFCQNHQISQDYENQQKNLTDCQTLARQIVDLQNTKGVHNINFVSPSHFVPQMLRTLIEAIPMGLRVPVVYNTNAYDSLETLYELDGVVDIYLPDLKFANNEWARQISGCKDYVSHARAAIREMFRQVGRVRYNAEGIAERGLIVRHLILPDDLAGSKESLKWIADLSTEITVSLMAQYYPCHRALDMPPLARTISVAEYRTAINMLDILGIENGWLQEPDAKDYYIPDFQRNGHPFISY